MGAYSKGFELLGAVVGMGLFGYWIGGYWEKSTLGLAIGGVLGIVGGMYNLVRQGLGANRRSSTKRGNPET